MRSNIEPPRYVSNRRATRAGFLVALLAVGGLARGETVWKLDNLEEIGGQRVQVVGAPKRVKTEQGAAVAFDGAHDGLFIPELPVAGAKAFTIEVRMRPLDGGLEAQRFLHLQDEQAHRSLIELRTDRRGHWWLDTFLRVINSPTGDGLTLIDPALVHPTGQWYWVALRFDGQRMSSYVNGRKELEGETSGTVFGKGKISIGVRQNLVSWFKGEIAEVRFHREAISPDKLQRAKE